LIDWLMLGALAGGFGPEPFEPPVLIPVDGVLLVALGNVAETRGSVMLLLILLAPAWFAGSIQLLDDAMTPHLHSSS